MKKLPAQYHEVEQLAHAVMNGSAGQAEGARLGELLMTDQKLCQWYLYQTDMHAQLSMLRDENADNFVQTWLAEPKQPANQRRKLAIAGGISGLLCMCMALVFLWMLFPVHTEPAAQIVGLTSDAASPDSTLQAGDVLTRNQLLQVTSGVVTIELKEGARVAVTADTTVEVMDDNELWLSSGKIMASVPEQAIGFLVRASGLEVTDLGTEFAIDIPEGEAPRVAVRQGLVEARAVDDSGNVKHVRKLTEGRAVQFDLLNFSAVDLNVAEDWFDGFEQVGLTTGGVARAEGSVRSVVKPPVSFVAGAFKTQDNIYLIAERESVELPENLVIHNGPSRITLPAGTVVDSYLLHYDLDQISVRPPIGSVAFGSEVLAVIHDSDVLIQTDALFGLENTDYPISLDRGLETKGDPSDIDQVNVSSTGHEVTFHLAVDASKPLDQFRVLIRSDKH
ncbi:FecR domain-containing protein [Calycomorphotria hydatis]|uniref:FecR protein n=1 Tax=Calycomorphotria hydatis TaxID=2528027 RepID=A0A517TEX4_9PLAN|nr:FecR domain-containing protein [Calycomorphotria hydatis]QDT66922.1 FecR protein [Calycomorphotria hydatis]